MPYLGDKGAHYVFIPTGKWVPRSDVAHTRLTETGNGEPQIYVMIGILDRIKKRVAIPTVHTPFPAVPI